MIYRLVATDSSYGTEVVVDREDLGIILDNPTAEIYNKYFIMQQVIESQRSRVLQEDWIKTGKSNWMEDELKFDSEGNKSDELLRYSVSSLNSSRPYRVEIQVIPDAEEEIELLIEISLQHNHGTSNESINNSMICLPRISYVTEYSSAKRVGKYLVVNSIGFEDYYFGNRNKGNWYWFVFKISDLVNSHITIYSPEFLVPHVIGKGGKCIKEILDLVRRAGYNKVKKIDVRSL